MLPLLIHLRLFWCEDLRKARRQLILKVAISSAAQYCGLRLRRAQGSESWCEALALAHEIFLKLPSLEAPCCPFG